jgi:hypothetical protein
MQSLGSRQEMPAVQQACLGAGSSGRCWSVTIIPLNFNPKPLGLLSCWLHTLSAGLLQARVPLPHGWHVWTVRDGWFHLPGKLPGQRFRTCDVLHLPSVSACCLVCLIHCREMLPRGPAPVAAARRVAPKTPPMSPWRPPPPAAAAAGAGASPVAPLRVTPVTGRQLMARRCQRVLVGLVVRVMRASGPL